MRKSFIIHNDSLSVLNKLSNEEKGILFQAIADYNNGVEVKLDRFMEVVFEPFKNQFVRDNDKYDKKVEINRLNGSKGGKRKVANATKRYRPQTDLADSDSDSNNDSDNNNDNNSKFNFKKKLIDYGFSKQLVVDWLAVRKTKKVTNTKSAFDSFISEVESKKPTDINLVLKICCENSWAGFKWSWVEKLGIPIQKIELPHNWMYVKLTPEQWALLTPQQRSDKQNEDVRKAMQI